MNSPQNEIYNCLIGPSSGGSSSDDEQYTLTDMPQNWAVSHQVLYCAISDLLVILRQFHPFLSKGPRTLSQTEVT